MVQTLTAKPAGSAGDEPPQTIGNPEDHTSLGSKDMDDICADNVQVETGLHEDEFPLKVKKLFLGYDRPAEVATALRRVIAFIFLSTLLGILGAAVVVAAIWPLFGAGSTPVLTNPSDIDQRCSDGAVTTGVVQDEWFWTEHVLRVSLFNLSLGLSFCIGCGMVEPPSANGNVRRKMCTIIMFSWTVAVVLGVFMYHSNLSAFLDLMAPVVCLPISGLCIAIVSQSTKGGDALVEPQTRGALLKVMGLFVFVTFVPGGMAGIVTEVGSIKGLKMLVPMICMVAGALLDRMVKTLWDRFPGLSLDTAAVVSLICNFSIGWVARVVTTTNSDLMEVTVVAAQFGVLEVIITVASALWKARTWKRMSQGWVKDESSQRWRLRYKLDRSCQFPDVVRTDIPHVLRSGDHVRGSKMVEGSAYEVKTFRMRKMPWKQWLAAAWDSMWRTGTQLVIHDVVGADQLSPGGAGFRASEIGRNFDASGTIVVDQHHELLASVARVERGLLVLETDLVTSMLSEHATIWAWLLTALIGQLSPIALGEPTMATSLKDVYLKTAALFCCEGLADIVSATLVPAIVPLQLVVSPRIFKTPMKLLGVFLCIFAGSVGTSQITQSECLVCLLWSPNECWIFT